MESQTPRLYLSEEETVLVDAVIDDMIKFYKRKAISLSVPRDVFGAGEEVSKVDEVIAYGVDKLRVPLKNDFIEKLTDRLNQKCCADQQNVPLVAMALRSLDTMMYVISLTKRYRGVERVPAVDPDLARAELKARGLWKK